jgi:hypothetical protein
MTKLVNQIIKDYLEKTFWAQPDEREVEETNQVISNISDHHDPFGRCRNHSYPKIVRIP